MPEFNPNYVPVEWPDEEAHARKGFGGQRPDLVVLDEGVDYCPRCGGPDNDHTLLCPMRDQADVPNAVDESACPATCPLVDPHHHVHDEIVFTTPVTAKLREAIAEKMDQIAPVFDESACSRRGIGNHDCVEHGTPEDTDPARETSTLNSSGDPIKIGDRVHHQSDAGTDNRSVGVVTYIGTVTINDVEVENGSRVRWDDAEDDTPHHVDLLSVIV